MATDATLVSVTIQCPTSGEVSVTPNDYYVGADRSECDLCGSHGYVNLEVIRCPDCGKAHTISLSDW